MNASIIRPIASRSSVIDRASALAVTYDRLAATLAKALRDGKQADRRAARKARNAARAEARAAKVAARDGGAAE